MVVEVASGQDGEEENGLSYREQIEDALQEDTQRIGDVWRQISVHGRHAESIKDALGMATVGPVYSCLGSIDTLLKCERLTEAPILAVQRARMLRNFVKRNDQLSQVIKDRLSILATEHQRIAEDEKAVADEAKQIEGQGQGLSSGTPGIYVYTLPHYIKNPVIPAESDESNDRTYLKVGMSRVDAKGRIQQQVTTALPEPPLILRRYALGESKKLDPKKVDYKKGETRMHRQLNAADHNQNRRRGAGKEWFLAHLTFIDSIAELLGLVREYEDENYPSELMSE